MIQVQLLLACMALLARVPRDGDQGAWLAIGRERPGLGTAIVLGVCGFCCGAIILSCRRAGHRLDRHGDHRALLMALRVRSLAVAIATIATVAGILGLGTLDGVRGLIGNVILFDELAALLPLLLVLGVGWWAHYPLERRAREAVIVRALDWGEPVYPIEGRWGHLLLHVRHELLLVLVPISLIMAWAEAVSWYESTKPAWMEAMGPGSWASSAAFVAGVVVVLGVTPLLLRVLWDVQRLGDGELRTRIERVCSRWNVKVRELLLWRTHHSMPNAAVMGLIAPLRYILLSDALLDGLEEDQVEAVAAHEVAHVRKRHMPWLAAAVIGPVTLLGSLAEMIAKVVSWIDPDGTVFLGIVGGLTLAIVLGVLGFVSRRFEWQADAFGARHMSEVAGEQHVSERAVEAMSGALSRVAQLAGIPQVKGSWRHGSIAARRQRLQALVAQPVDRLAIDRTVARVKLVVVVVALLAVGMATVV